MDDGKAFRVGCFGAMGAMVGLMVLSVLVAFIGLFLLVGCPAVLYEVGQHAEDEMERQSHSSATEDPTSSSQEVPDRERHEPPSVGPIALEFYTSPGPWNATHDDADSLRVIFTRSSNTPLAVRWVGLNVSCG
jgi:hypothetical protein